MQSEFYTARWEAARAGGRTSLLSSDEQRAYGRVYTDLSTLKENIQEEREAWSHLRALQHLRRLLPDEIYDQRLALSRARQADAGFRWAFNNTKNGAGLVGLKGDAKLRYAPGEAAEVERAPLICEPLNGAKGRR